MYLWVFFLEDLVGDLAMGRGYPLANAGYVTPGQRRPGHMVNGWSPQRRRDQTISALAKANKETENMALHCHSLHCALLGGRVASRKDVH